MDGDPGLRYVIDGPRPGLFTVSDDPTKPPKRLLSWAPEVEEHLIRLDEEGRCVERAYRIRVGDVRQTISSDDLVTGRVWREMIPGAKGTGRSRVRDALENVVTEQAVDLPSTWMLKRTGWYDLPDGRWVYVPACGLNRPDVKIRTKGLPTPLVKAAAPLEKPAGRPALKRLIGQLATHGWGPGLGLATGVRALAWSIVPVRGSLVPVGLPNTGKSMTFWVAGCVTLPGGWPPLVDTSFNDTITAMEKKVGAAGDRAVGIEDMPLTAMSDNSEVREAVAKADRITRSGFNNTTIRDRGDRQGDIVPDGSTVRGIPILTAQRMPTGVQASMYRRVVLAEFEEGDNDFRWYEKNGEAMEPVIRTIGDKVIAHMEKMGKDQATAWVKSCDKTAKEKFLPVARPVLGAAPDGMDGVLKAAWQMLAGLQMAAEACDLDMEPIWQSVMHKFAVSLAGQARTMADRQTADTGLDEAIGSALRKAFQERRAHVRSPQQAVPSAMVPGQTPQAQGLREDVSQGQSSSLSGEGCSVYYLEDLGALGVSATDLHTVIAAARDARLTGFPARTLPSHLLKHGAVLKSTQAGQTATTKVRIGGAKGKLMPLVLIPAATVFTLPENEEPEPPAPGQLESVDGPEGPAPAGPEPTDEPEQTAFDIEDQEEKHDQEQTAEPPVQPVAAVPAPALVPAPRPEPAQAAQGDAGAVVLVTGGQLVHAATMASLDLSEGARTDMGQLLAEVGQAEPHGHLTVVIGEDAHRGYRLGAEAPGLAGSPWSPGFKSAVDAGWHKPFNPGRKPYVGTSALLAHPDRKGDVRVMPVKWIAPDMFPRYRTRAMVQAGEHDKADALTLAYRLARFSETTGYAFESTHAATGIKMMRAMVEATAERRPKWQGSTSMWPTVLDDSDWSRPLTDDEATGSHVHLYDGVKAYLPAYRQAIVSGDDLRRVTGRDALFDKSMAGLWRITVPYWPHENLPAPVPNAKPGAVVTVTTAIVQAYLDVGICPEISEAWIAKAIAFEGLRRFSDSIRDQLVSLEASGDEDDRTVASALKEVFHSVHGKLRNSAQGIMRRPDWGHAIRDAAWASILRKAYIAAGLIPVRGQRAPEDERRFPVRVKTDELAYPGTGEDPTAAVPFGLRLVEGEGSNLGRFHPDSMPMDDYRQEQDAKRRQAEAIRERLAARRAAQKGKGEK
ncbi:hypothetical protein [Streptomyces uncialis]|uniref:hypothetical protein n=1 Tax=Streptomyces uncialis TaxID=1048205 RepID=UPI00224FF5B8|nr:hypothetical protein [Streptomyces uncialis]MCX4665066.1 hypothetical protein [Streptomyces uncialis]